LNDLLCRGLKAGREGERMGYREVTMVEVREILRLWAKGLGKKTIAARLGLDVKTVRRYIQAALDCGHARSAAGEGAPSDEKVLAVLARARDILTRPHGTAWDLCEEQRKFIEGHLKSGVRLMKVCRLLRRNGVEVPYGTLYRYAVRELAFGGAPPTIPVADGEPGQELQVDTGWMTLLDPDLFGKRRKFRAWIFTPGVSRYRFVWPCFPETTESAIEACEAAWSFYGGIFSVLIPDNTKAIVNEADPLEPKITVAFLEYAQARGFVIDPTRARHAKDKGRVERTVRDVRDDCFGGERLGSLPQARERARYWCTAEYGMRRHGRTGRLPAEHFATEERPRLLPAPLERYDVPLWAHPKVGRDQLAQVGRALYSLPTRYVGRRLVARADRTVVRFWDAKTLVKTHPRMPWGGRSCDRGDYPAEKTAYALRDVAYLERKAREHGEAVGRYAHALLEGELPWTRMRRVYALLRLAERHGAGEVNAACGRALEAELVDVKRLRRMVELAAPGGMEVARQPGAKYLRPAATYALPLWGKALGKGGA